MKKILTAALAVIAMATALTGCENPTVNDSQNESSTVESGLTLTASEMAERALGCNTQNWSMAMTIADDETLSVLLPDLSADMFEDFCFYYDMIGINGHSVFVGKPKAGQEDAVKAVFEKNLNDFKERVSFYPAGQESVDGAVSGTTDNGYEYFVIHQDGEAVASAMVDPNAPKVDFSSLAGSEDENSGEENSDGEASVLIFPDNGAGNMVKTALGTKPENWSEGMAIANSNELSRILKNGVTADMFEEFCLAYDSYSNDGHSVFVGKPKAGQEEAVKTALENAFNAYKAEIAMFPEGSVNSENAATGTTDDGYNYFVIHADGAAIASAMTAPVF